MALFTPIFDLFFTLVILCTVCELAGKMGSEFETFNDQIDQFDWYLMPLEIQKMLPLIMMDSQQEVGFTCFGSIMCNRETFRKVRVLYITINDKMKRNLIDGCLFFFL